MQIWRKLQHGDFSLRLVTLALVGAVICHAATFLLLVLDAPLFVRLLLLCAPVVAGGAIVWLLLSIRARLSLVQEAVDATQSAFVVYDAQDRLVICNKSYREVLGLPERAFVPGVPYVDLMRMSLRETPLQEAIEEEVRRRLRLQQIADGVPSDRRYPGNRWLRVTKTRTRRGTNVGVAIDVTEYYELRERLETEVARFSALAQGAPVAICQVDAGGGLRFANDPFLAMFGARSLEGLSGDAGAGRREFARLAQELAQIPNDGEMELVTGIVRRDYMVRKAYVPTGNVKLTMLSPGTAAGESIYIFIDITERKRVAARMKHLALHDALTGAFNRIAFAEDLAAAVATAGEAHPASLIAIDLDRFKPVNDLYGHLAGDELLRQVVRRIEAALPPGFRVYRTGGDEFCVLGVECSRLDVVVVAETLLERMVEPFDVHGHRARIGASVGFSLLPDDARTGEALMHYADLAMYHVKSMGGGRVAQFDHHVLSSVDSRRVLEADFAAALQDRDLRVVFQPVFGLDRTRPVGAEALVRWHNRRVDREMSPAGFIPIAEETGLVRDMDLQVFALAIEEFARWTRIGVAPQVLALNMSTRTLETADIVASMVAVLRNAGVDGKRVVIEVTESFAVRHAADLCRTIHSLAQHGVRFAIDDFGTGYTSFRLLADLPIQFVKIDRSFVHDLVEADAASRAIVQAILNVARDLRLDVVAEGVETEAQYQALRGLGCSLFQGFLLGRPQSGAEIAAMMMQHDARLRA